METYEVKEDKKEYKWGQEAWVLLHQAHGVWFINPDFS